MNMMSELNFLLGLSKTNKGQNVYTSREYEKELVEKFGMENSKKLKRLLHVCPIGLDIGKIRHNIYSFVR